MPRIKAVTDAGGTKFYPSSITPAIYDIERNQKLTATLKALENAIGSITVMAGKLENVPRNPKVGQMYFCTDLTSEDGSPYCMPIFYTGTLWVNPLGGEIQMKEEKDDTV